MKVFLKGLNSCAMRRQKLEQYRNFLTANGHEITADPAGSDVILVWTCAFRGDVRDNSISEIRRYQRDYPGELIVTGCLPDISPDLLSENFSGRIISWRNDREKLEELFGCRLARLDQIPQIYVERKLCDDAEIYRRQNPDKDATFHDQFIKLVISEGCNFECAYCSERLAFPPFHSFPEDELVAACRRMAAKTHNLDVILLADSLGDYGCDNGSSLPRLIRKLKRIHPALRLALNNLNPSHFIKYCDDMIELLRRGDIRHLNLPIQSASPRILNLMNRTYTVSELEKIFGLLNSIAFNRFDTHIIVGFPGEMEDDFADTMRFLRLYRPSYVLLSGFMESAAMPAAQLPNKVDDETKRRRLREGAASLRDAGIICNTDESELSAERCRRLNSIS